MTRNLSYLRFISQNKADADHFKNVLLKAHKLSWSAGSFTAFEHDYNAIINNIDDNFKDLFNLYLITDFLINVLTSDHESLSYIRSLINDNIDLSRYLGIPPELLEKSRWCKIPVLVTGKDKAYIRFFIAGLLKPDSIAGLLKFDSISMNKSIGMPSWACDLMDHSTRSALETAAEAAKQFTKTGIHNKIHPCKQILFVYPLTTPWDRDINTFEDKIKFKGKSLGLPLAIGFAGLLKNEPVSDRLIATGAIEKNGQVRSIGYIGAKIKEAHQENYQAIIYPCGNYNPSGIYFCDSQKIGEQQEFCIPVVNFQEAWMFFSLYSKQDFKKLLTLPLIYNDIHGFINNITQIPFQWIEWMHKEKYLEKNILDIFNDISLFKEFEEKFQSLVSNYRLQHADAAAKLIPPDKIDEMAAVAPDLVLRWYTSNLALSNHHGDTETSLKWQRKGNKIVENSRLSDSDAPFNFFNHSLIAAHNRYDFNPDLPQKLKDYLEWQEKQYQKKPYLENKIFCNSDFSFDEKLGHLYGTIAQNYAFCGTKYIEKVKLYSRKARKAFGDENKPEYRQDWLRQYNYLTYAYLDSGDFKSAYENFARYLEIKRPEELLNIMGKPLSPWQYAIIVRFFSQVLDTVNQKSPNDKDTKEKKRTGKIQKKPEDHEQNRLYMDTDLCEKLFPTFISNSAAGIYHKMQRFLHSAGSVNDHPWQLINYNLGRIALFLGHNEQAKAMFEKSIEICFSPSSGHTIRIMALLPISMLAYPELVYPDDDRLSTIKQAYSINKLREIKNNKTIEWENKIRHSAEFMEKSHFLFLTENSFEKALQTVRRSPEYVFPFSYR